MATDRFERAEETVEPLAPRWHTAVLVSLMIAVAATGALLARGGATLVAPSSGGRVVAAYLPLMVVNWGLTIYVCRVGRARNALRSLLGRGWDGPGRACADLALAAAAWLVVEASEWAVGTWHNAAVAALLPHTGAERVAWVLVAATVGFCEEVIYRGYLQTQLAAFTGRVGLAVALQGVLFGMAHGEQGIAVAARFTLYGVVFGALARWRRSLIPGIAAHIGIDLASGLLAP